jgi:hypothetical protein
MSLHALPAFEGRMVRHLSGSRSRRRHVRAVAIGLRGGSDLRRQLRWLRRKRAMRWHLRFRVRDPGAARRRMRQRVPMRFRPRVLGRRVLGRQDRGAALPKFLAVRGRHLLRNGVHGQSPPGPERLVQSRLFSTVRRRPGLRRSRRRDERRRDLWVRLPPRDSPARSTPSASRLRIATRGPVEARSTRAPALLEQRGWRRPLRRR